VQIAQIQSGEVEPIGSRTGPVRRVMVPGTPDDGCVCGLIFFSFCERGPITVRGYGISVSLEMASDPTRLRSAGKALRALRLRSRR
jgi:hypothetical protein